MQAYTASFVKSNIILQSSSYSEGKSVLVFSNKFFVSTVKRWTKSKKKECGDWRQSDQKQSTRK